MYIALEYLSYVIAVVLFCGVLFAGSTLFVLSQEGARYLATSTRRVAQRAAAAAKSAVAVSSSASNSAR